MARPARQTRNCRDVLYAGAMAWLAPHPPMADLPQHAGQIVLLRDLLLGQSAWESLLRINYFTPYLIGYGLALPLTFVMPIAAALKLLLMLAFYAFVFCCMLLRRHFRADERLDWLFIPGFFGFAYAWGFFTFLVAAPLGLLFVLLADRYARHPTTAGGARLGAVGAILFFSHGLVFVFACGIGVALLLVRSKRWQSTFSTLFPYAPLAVLSATYALVSHSAETGLENGLTSTLWGAWESRLNVLGAVFGTAWYDAHDALFVAVGGIIMLWAPRLLGSRLNRDAPWVFVPMAAMLLVWLAAPNYAMKTSFIYHRFALFILPFYALMFRRPVSSSVGNESSGMQPQVCQILLATICWLFLAGQTDRLVRFAQEDKDFEMARAAVEPGQRALSLVLDCNSTAARSAIGYLHHPSWYQAENGGFVDFNFAWFPPQIVRYRPDSLPGVRTDWTPERFEWTRDQAWRYRYFFVRHTQPLASNLFTNRDCEISLLKSVGSWSIYESRNCRPPEFAHGIN
jgi:hypothetical protein